MSRAEQEGKHRMGCPMSSCKSIASERGFSYLWTLFLIAFMSIGLVIASEVYSTGVRRDKERELIFIGREFRNAIGRYYESGSANGQRQYPAALEDLLKDPRFPNTRRYLRRIYTDPMTGKGEWGIVWVKGRIAGIYSLSTQKPIKQDNFEALEAGFRGKEKYSEWTFTYPADLVLTTSDNATNPKHPGEEKDVGKMMAAPANDGAKSPMPEK